MSMNPLDTPERKRVLLELRARQAEDRRQTKIMLVLGSVIWAFLIGVYLITRPF